MYNHNKAQQSKNCVHISWDILYTEDAIHFLMPNHNSMIPATVRTLQNITIVYICLSLTLYSM